MFRKSQNLVLGIVLTAMSFVCFADRNEEWYVTVAQFTSTFKLNIKDDGTFDGNSKWDCCSGVNNPIDGVIKGNAITLNRHLQDNQKGQTQVWEGTYTDGGKKVSGNCTGLGCPLSWDADVRAK
jgi:hypothetical protein